jgi:hypothetical protein
MRKTLSEVMTSHLKPHFVDLFGPFVQGVVDLDAFIDLTLEGLHYGAEAP